VAEVPFEHGGEPWELRAVAVEPTDRETLRIIYAPVVAERKGRRRQPGPSAEAPPIEPASAGAPTPAYEGSNVPEDVDAAPLLAVEGESVRPVRPYGLATDDAPLPDSGHVEPGELRSVRWFRSPEYRRAYVEQRRRRASEGLLPDALRVSAGSGLGSGFELRWTGRALELQRSSPEDRDARPVSAEPEDTRWRAFWHEIDRLDAWAWRDRYEPAVFSTDGYAWEVSIVRGGQRCFSSGYMAFPGADPWSEASATWDGFLLALSDLLGGVRLA